MDLVAALAADSHALAAFDRLGRSDRYTIILQILKARTAERRAALIAKAVADLRA